MTFDPSKHLRNIKGKGGNAEYLDVKWRLVWLREEHPDAATGVEHIEISPDIAIFKATVSIPGGGSATDYGSETPRDFGDYIEKAATKALGRALAQLGYGTQFVGEELSEGVRIVDSPVERAAQPAYAPQRNGSAPTRLVAPPTPQSAPQPPAPALAPDDPLADVLATLRGMETRREPWAAIKQYADEQSLLADDYGKQTITSTLHGIAARRKAAAPAAPSFAGAAG